MNKKLYQVDVCTRTDKDSIFFRADNRQIVLNHILKLLQNDPEIDGLRIKESTNESCVSYYDCDVYCSVSIQEMKVVDL